MYQSKVPYDGAEYIAAIRVMHSVTDTGCGKQLQTIDTTMVAKDLIGILREYVRASLPDSTIVVERALDL